MCCKVFIKCFLIILNIVAMLAGIALVIVGAILQWGQDFLVNIIGPLLGALLGGTEANGSGYNFQLSDLKSILGSYGTYLGYSGVVMVVLGGVIALLAILGIAGAARESACCLIIYIIPISLIAAVLIVVFFFWVANKSQLKTIGETEFKKVIGTSYRGFSTNDPGSQFINLLNARLDCCGVSGYEDFPNDTNIWSRHETYQNISNNKQNTTQDVKIPVSCCHMYNYSFIPQNPQCPLDVYSNGSNAQTGCYDKIWDLMENYATYTSLTFAGLAFIMIVIVCMTGSLIHTHRKKSSKSV